MVAIPVDAPVAPTGPTAIAADSVTPFDAPSGAPVAIPFSAIAYDDGHELDGHSRFTANSAGDYEVCAALAGPNSIAMLLELYVDGQVYGGLGSGTGIAHGCMSARLAAHQVLDVRVTQASGSTQHFVNDAVASWLTIHHEVALIEAAATTPLAVPATTFVPIVFDTVLHDDRHEFDPTTGELVASEAGDYRFCVAVAVPAPLQFEVDLFENGARERAFVLSHGPGTGCRTVRLAAHDRVGLDVYSGTATAIPANSAWTRVTIAELPTLTQLSETAPFTATASTFAQVLYDSPLVDGDGAYDVGAHHYAVASAGDYEICASLVNLLPTVTQLELVVSGATDKTIAAETLGACGCRIVRAPAGATIQVDEASSATDYEGNYWWDWMTIRRLQ